MREPRKPIGATHASPTPDSRRPEKPPAPPGCHNCVHAVWDPTDTIQNLGTGWPVRPRCSNHPDTPGQLRKVPGPGPCRNWRRKPDPLLRLDPGAQTDPHECRITLTKGLFAVVDPEDYEWLNGFRWHATTSRGRTYAATVINGKSISMHRLIMNPPPGMQVDHKSKDRLNNHRYNLRLATARQNRHNTGPVKRKDRPKSSQFVGVTRHGDKWKAKITHEGKEHFLGLFDDEIEAALAWDAKAKELRGEFAYLNFPDGPPPGYEKRGP